MIDPTKITNYNRDQQELEEFLLFCICVAGKTAKQIAKALDKFLKVARKRINFEMGEYYLQENKDSPFSLIRYLCDNYVLEEVLFNSRLGQHTKLYRAFIEVVNKDIDLKTCTPQDLEEIHGVGPKTSRFFILHSRPNQKIAVLDTHILQWLGRKGYAVPKSTPSGKKYYELEQAFIKEANNLNKDIAALDLEIWNDNARSGAKAMSTTRI